VAKLRRSCLSLVLFALIAVGPMAVSAENHVQEFVEHLYDTKFADYVPPSDDVLATTLLPEQLASVRHEPTEQPFDNLYWNNGRPGVYVDAVSGEPLFSSLDKFGAGTGWPSFQRPLPGVKLEIVADHLHRGENRKEVRSHSADSHLGHIFTDGPVGDEGKRYDIHSGSLRFVPVAELEAEGLGVLKEVLFDEVDFV